MRLFRFGLGKSRAKDAGEYLEAAARAEGAGYDVMLCADHLGALSPTVALASVAQTTDRLRLCALVLNNDFRHPALVAQEAATIDLMSGGRYELGIGAGWNIPEYAESGIEFDRAGARIARMGETMEILERLFAGGVVSFSGEYYTITDHQLDPQPPQGSALPMLVGGNGPKVLGVAARHADIIGLTGISMTPEGPELSHLAVPAIGERIAYVRDQAGARGDELEFNALVQHVDVTGDRRGASRSLAEAMSADTAQPVDSDVLLDSPFFLFGTPAQLVEQLHEIREKTRISYFTIRADGSEGFDMVVEELSGR
jgi:probable F420-dependent oxidoreductase